MKKLFAAAMSLGIAALSAATLVPVSMQLRGPYRVAMPIATDSVDTKGKKYQTEALLTRTIRQTLQKGGVIETADSIYVIPAGAEGLYTLSTKLRSDAYFSGKVVVKSVAPFAIYLQGKKLAVKESREDTISTASAKSQPITLDPELTCDLEVRVLAMNDNATPVEIKITPDKDSEMASLYMGTQLKRRYTLADTDQGERATSTQISPDGKYALVRYTNRTDQQKVIRRTEVIDTKTLASLGETNASAAWLPTGHTLYAATQGNADSYTISTILLPSMKPTTLHKDVPSGDFVWAPDTTFIVYSSIQEPEKNSSAFRRYASPDDRIEGNRRRYGLKKYTFATGIEEDVTFGTKNSMLAGISPDSRRLLCMVQRETPSKYPFYETDLLEIDLQSMKADTLVAANPYISGAIYSPDGKQLFITGSPRTFGDLGLNAGNHPIPNDFDTQGYIFDIATKGVRAVTRNFNPSISGVQVWNQADGKIYFRAMDGFCVALYALDPADGKIAELPCDMQNVSNFSIGLNENRFLTYTGQGDDYAGRASMLNLTTRRTTILADPFAARLDKIELGPTTEWTFTTSDGTPIDGTMTLPPDFNPEKKYPLIVYYYGGTSPSQHGLLHPYVPQLYASRGYVVYVLNPSGTYGYGQEFSARHVNAWGKRTADDIIEGVKKFCAEHPFVDEKKIGCMGASYGGFMTQYLQTQTDIFAAAISHAGISDVTSYWGEGYWGYTYNSVAAAESYPWTNPELFTRQGSLFNADKIHTPLLLIHGTADTNVPIGESIQIFNALRVLGRDVEFISVDGENHTSGSFPFAKRQIWHDTILAWFAKYLKDDSRWWNKLYPDPKL